MGHIVIFEYDDQTVIVEQPTISLVDVLSEGPQGPPGAIENLEFRSTATHLEWRDSSGSPWQQLVALSALGISHSDIDAAVAAHNSNASAHPALSDRIATLEAAGGGGTGNDGADGREVELRATLTHIQWRYVGSSSWTNLVTLSSLKGDKGDPGDPGDSFIPAPTGQPDGRILVTGVGGLVYQDPADVLPPYVGLTIVETAEGQWSADAPVRTVGHNPIEFRSFTDPVDPQNGIATPSNINNYDSWRKAASVIGEGGTYGGTIAQLTPADDGSSDPTELPTNKAITRTDAGRILAVHGKHKSGVQLAWSDNAGATFSRVTRGSVTDGSLLEHDIEVTTGDWPSTIVLGTVNGLQVGWVFIAANWSGSDRNLYGRRLTDLDNPAGPFVGPLQLLSNTIGDSKCDAAVEPHPTTGQARVCVSWLATPTAGNHRMSAAWVDDVTSNTFSLVNRFDFLPSAPGSTNGTLVEAPGGLAFIGRADPGGTSSMRMWRRSDQDALNVWTLGSGVGGTISSNGYPSAVYANGEFITVAQRSETNENLRLGVFSLDGNSYVAVTPPVGYLTPVICSQPDTGYIQIYAVRIIDGVLVRWERSPAGTWNFIDEPVFYEVDEIFWPNTDRLIRDGVSQLVLSERTADPNKAIVWYYNSSSPSGVAPASTFLRINDEWVN